MISNPVSKMTVISPTEHKAFMKLVQRVTEIPVMKEQWIQDCITAFGWSEQYTRNQIEDLRRAAKKELADAGT